MSKTADYTTLSLLDFLYLQKCLKRITQGA